MSKVLSFIEWVDKRKQKLLEDLQVLQNSILPMNSYDEREKLFKQFVVDIAEGQDFYNQKFDVSMLVNNVCDCIGECEENKKRLFEGWELIGIKTIIHKDIAVWYSHDFNSWVISSCAKSLRAWGFNTLDEFIVSAKRCIKLSWDINNPKVKELGL